ncbi:hypothetical protein K466DRAFT_569097 [Polyporus arcularius HHB13444]|uniref:Extracellular metalloproteinase n=1 Tax=Polyporus arcularius HHB13444 TaxID=1314778 RepID=A0A5C3NV53_9APHY|nr:hypothetical protein K466DRAFT_569097 [Polyporus arcularius HHB13444]
MSGTHSSVGRLSVWPSNEAPGGRIGVRGGFRDTYKTYAVRRSWAFGVSVHRVQAPAGTHNFGGSGHRNESVQDGSDHNSADFMTWSDGQTGRRTMYLRDAANHYRDGDLEAGIVIRELAHGFSTRIIGFLSWGKFGAWGPRARHGALGCCGGHIVVNWPDLIVLYRFLATTARGGSDFGYAMGSSVADWEKGVPITSFPLFLWIVSSRPADRHRFVGDPLLLSPIELEAILGGDSCRRPWCCVNRESRPPVAEHCNSLITRLDIARNPSFDARRAIISIARMLAGGENVCDIWEGFRTLAGGARGVPPPSDSATGDSVDDGDDDDGVVLHGQDREAGRARAAAGAGGGEARARAAGAVGGARGKRPGARVFRARGGGPGDRRSAGSDGAVLASIFSTDPADRYIFTYGDLRLALISLGFAAVPNDPRALRPTGHLAAIYPGFLVYNPANFGNNVHVPSVVQDVLAFTLWMVWGLDLSSIYPIA